MTVGPDVDQAPGEAPGQLSAPVLDALAGQLDQRKRDREAEARRAAAHGGPCAYCGVVESWERPGVLGRWHTDYGRPCCVPCARDGELLGRGIAGDVERRARAIRQVLGQAPAPPWAGHGPSRRPTSGTTAPWLSGPGSAGGSRRRAPHHRA